MQQTGTWNQYTYLFDDLGSSTLNDDLITLTYTGTGGVTLSTEALWQNFILSFPNYSYVGKIDKIYTGGGNDNITRATGGGIFSGG